jgi:NADH-ubiquinone oxidoreductase complex I, 21 kDa subunit
MVRLDRKAPFPVIHRDPTAKQVFNNFTPRDTAIVGAATIGTGFYGYAIGE